MLLPDEPTPSADDYEGKHRLEPVFTLTDQTEAMVFYNAARGGFQRAKGAEMISACLVNTARVTG